MREYDYSGIQNKLRKEMDPHRYEHTLGVMYTSGALAMVYDCSLDALLR